MHSNYDKNPYLTIENFDHASGQGWEAICSHLRKAIPDDANFLLVIETYPGVHDEEIVIALKQGLMPDALFMAKEAFLSEEEIDQITYPDVTDDRIFGCMTRLEISSFFDQSKKINLTTKIRKSSGLVIVYGTGATELVDEWDMLVYADMARWEIQKRMRREEVANLGVSNFSLEFSRKYKRAYFVDWRVADKLKRALMSRWDFVLDTNMAGQPKMASAEAIKSGFEQAMRQPFRVVPFFDPGPWGGQWMKKVCDLDRSVENYAWCFDCVPEENSIQFRFGDICMELPAINLVFFYPKRLLGQEVYGRFGAEFPIRFDFLDTMDGGNLSLQVHPLTAYIREHFGMLYTQDESYYILDSKEDAIVYLGLKEDVDPEGMIRELQAAQEGGPAFDVDKHVEKWAVKKHDHVLIPAGTVHCSGKNSMVLEISATPYIFTFKLWDWGRLGLDGLPRPINIDHGKENIQWDRRKDWVQDNLINCIETVAEGDGWREERTGLHETEFIETRRHWFTKKVHHYTNGGVQVINLVEGKEVIVESPFERFEPFIVHYAETFIIPAEVGEYTIRPFGESEGNECATLKAYVRI